MEESIIRYCQHRLGLDSWWELRSLDVMPKFLDLVLSEELMSIFPPEQYRFAANLIKGGKTNLKDYGSTIAYLQKFKSALAKCESGTVRRNTLG